MPVQVHPDSAAALYSVRSPTAGLTVRISSWRTQLAEEDFDSPTAPRASDSVTAVVILIAMRSVFHYVVRVISIGLFLAALCYTPPGWTSTVTLSRDEASFVRSILQRDQFLKELARSESGLQALTGLLRNVTSGTVELDLEWAQGDIKAWRNLHGKLVEIEMTEICNEIAEHEVEDTKNEEFFEQLYEARGCD